MGVLLTFDIGTTSVKGCAFDESFCRVASFHREYALETPREHWVEADAQAYWRAVAEGTRELLSSGIRPQDVRCVTFTTQGETFIPVDRAGRPLSPAIVWLDDRAREEARDLSEAIDREVFYHTTGIPEITAATPLAKLRWHVKRRPEIHQKTYRYLLLEDYLILRMTGRFVTEQSLVSSTGYYDIVRRQYWTDALKACGIGEDQLCPVIPCASVAGVVTAEAAAHTGLCAGTPVVAGAMDQICAALGAGNFREGILSENTGTCLAVAATLERPVFSSDGSVPVYTHFDRRYLLLAYNPTAAMVLKWFKDQFMGEYACQLDPSEDLYEALTREAGGAPVLSGGVTVIPHFSGRLFPGADADMRGAFVGLSLGTTRAHCIRAILESVAYMLRQSAGAIESLGVSVSQIRSVGGASVSPLWNQIKASVTGFPIHAMRESESTSLGAAMLGAIGTGLYADAEEICNRFLRPVGQYHPLPRDRAAYERGFARFEEIDRRLSGLPVDNTPWE